MRAPEAIRASRFSRAYGEDTATLQPAPGRGSDRVEGVRHGRHGNTHSPRQTGPVAVSCSDARPDTTNQHCQKKTGEEGLLCSDALLAFPHGRIICRGIPTGAGRVVESSILGPVVPR